MAPQLSHNKRWRYTLVMIAAILAVLGPAYFFSLTARQDPMQEAKASAEEFRQRYKDTHVLKLKDALKKVIKADNPDNYVEEYYFLPDMLLASIAPWPHAVHAQNPALATSTSLIFWRTAFSKARIAYAVLNWQYMLSHPMNISLLREMSVDEYAKEVQYQKKFLLSHQNYLPRTPTFGEEGNAKCEEPRIFPPDAAHPNDVIIMANAQTKTLKGVQMMFKAQIDLTQLDSISEDAFTPEEFEPPSNSNNRSLMSHLWSEDSHTVTPSSLLSILRSDSLLKYRAPAKWVRYGGVKEKNWVPFVYKSNLLLMNHMNPVQVIRPVIRQSNANKRQKRNRKRSLRTDGDGVSTGGLMSTLGGSTNGDTNSDNVGFISSSKAGSTHTIGGQIVSLLSPAKHIPWQKEFSAFLRGGTPAVLLPKHHVYLTFFHTKRVDPDNADLAPSTSSLTNRYIGTYFFGALTFNASYPFNLVSVSEVPILPEPLYRDQPWVWSGLDFVMYPTGIILSPDADRVFVSSGYQDRHTVVMKFHVDRLLQSLKPVRY